MPTEHDIDCSPHGSRIEESDRDDTLARLRFVPRMAGRQNDSPGIGVKDRVLGECELLWYQGGSGHVVLSGERIGCRAGTLVMIKPWEIHSIRSSREDPHDNYWAHFSVEPALALDSFAASLFQPGMRSASIGEDPEARWLWAETVKEIHEKRFSYPEIAAALFTALVLRLRRLSVGAAPLAPPSPDERLIARIDAFIAAHLADDLDAETLCSQFPVGRTAFFKLFRRARGLSPAAYIRRERLRAAEALLRTGGYSVKEIAERVGFSDQFHFSRAFKDQYGVSPKQWLAQLIG